VLKQGVDNAHVLWNWHQQVLSGDPSARKDVDLEGTCPNGTDCAAVHYHLSQAWPSKLDGTSTIADVTIVADRIDVVGGAPAPVTKSVDGTSGPWKWVKGGLNANYSYSENDQAGFPRPPTVFTRNDGLNFAPGTTLHIRYVSGGTAQDPAYPLSDGNGYPVRCPPNPSATGGGRCPSDYFGTRITTSSYWGRSRTTPGRSSAGPFSSATLPT
jgi:hypothetical protein